MTFAAEQDAEAGVRPIFHGTRSSLAPIVFKGLALTIVTLGVYRFWYVTNVRRHLWNAVEIDGDYLEYTGRGVELFLGFLIALAVVIPLYAATLLVGAFVGPIGAVVVQNLVTLAIVFLAQFALFRARRYRLTRTIWRGVRFQQTGSGLVYAAKSLGWSLLAILSLGLAYPWMRASLERYKMTNTWYGDQQGGFQATGGQLFAKGWALWLASMALLAGPLAVAIAIGEAGAQEAGEPTAAAVLPLLGWLLIPSIFAVYLAIEYRWWANACAVGPARARCDLGLFQFLKTYAGYAGAAALLAIVVGVAFGAAAFLLRGSIVAFEAGSARYVAAAATVLAYFATALTFAALWQLFGVLPIWRKSFESVEIVGLGELQAVQSATPAANAFGEGIADAIDFGGF